MFEWFLHLFEQCHLKVFTTIKQKTNKNETTMHFFVIITTIINVINCNYHNILFQHLAWILNFQ